MRKYDLGILGAACRKYRQEKGISQREIAMDLGMYDSTISRFEQGASDSAYILLWYLRAGFTLRDLIREEALYAESTETHR